MVEGSSKGRSDQRSSGGFFASEASPDVAERRVESKIPCYFVELVGLFGIGLIEALGTHFETQAFHLEEDVVVTLGHFHRQVAEGVVVLLVVDVEQRGDFRECLANVFHESLSLTALLVGEDAELNQQHEAASVG